MRSHLTERIISAVWLATLGYLFIYSSFSSSPEFKSNLFIFSVFVITVSIFYFFLGFFHSYKILLLPADYLNTFPLRCISSVWSGSLSYFIIMGIYSFIFDDYTRQTNLMILIGFSIFFMFFSFLIGWIFL
jgi:hypothetical protein